MSDASEEEGGEAEGDSDSAEELTRQVNPRISQHRPRVDDIVLVLYTLNRVTVSIEVEWEKSENGTTRIGNVVCTTCIYCITNCNS